MARKAVTCRSRSPSGFVNASNGLVALALCRLFEKQGRLFEFGKEFHDVRMIKGGAPKVDTKKVSYKSLGHFGIAADTTYMKIYVECVRSGVYKNFAVLRNKATICFQEAIDLCRL